MIIDDHLKTLQTLIKDPNNNDKILNSIPYYLNTNYSKMDSNIKDKFLLESIFNISTNRYEYVHSKNYQTN